MTLVGRAVALYLIVAACDATPRAESQSAKQAALRTTPVSRHTVECRVTRVSDGDTIYCGSFGRIRLLMIDAPELAQGKPGRDAQRFLEQLLPVGTDVKVETDVQPRDTYNRILGYVYFSDGRMVNEVMARGGYVTALVYPPNVRYVERIRAAVADARKAKRGLWATDFFSCTPRDYRAGRCGGGQPQRSAPRRNHQSGRS